MVRSRILLATVAAFVVANALFPAVTAGATGAATAGSLAQADGGRPPSPVAGLPRALDDDSGVPAGRIVGDGTPAAQNDTDSRNGTDTNRPIRNCTSTIPESGPDGVAAGRTSDPDRVDALRLQWYQLWSGDVDDPDYRPVVDGNTTDAERMRQLQCAGDFAFERPPELAVDWNAGEVTSWPAAMDGENGHRTVYVPGNGSVPTVDGQFLRDVFVDVIGVSPSTRVGYRGPLYVPSERGLVEAVFDYRVALPNNDTAGSDRSTYRLVDAGATRANLTATTGGGRTALDRWHPVPAQGLRLRYRNLQDAPVGANTTLSASVTVNATVEKRTRTCADWNATRRTCDGNWSENRTTVLDSVTVRDGLDVRPYRLAGNVTVHAAQPYNLNGSLNRGVVTAGRVPWDELVLRRTPAGDSLHFHTQWSFFTAGLDRYRTLQRRSNDGNVGTVGSPVRPLSVYAVPKYDTHVVRDGPHHSSIAVRNVDGPRRRVGYPDRFDLGGMAAFTSVRSVAFRTAEDYRHAYVAGIVAGEGQQLSRVAPAVLLVRPELSVEVLGTTNGTTRLRIAVDPPPAGDFDTRGTVTVGDRTSRYADAPITVTVPEGSGRYRVRYVPDARFWTVSANGSLSAHAGVPTTQRVALSPAYPPFGTVVRILLGAAVTLLWLWVAAVSLDRLTGGALLGGRPRPGTLLWE